MSEKESEFIRQLRLYTISIVVVFVVSALIFYGTTNQRLNYLEDTYKQLSTKIDKTNDYLLMQKRN